MTAVAERRAGDVGAPDPGFRAVAVSEWIKLRTSRSVRRNLILGTVLGIGLSVFAAVAMAATFDEWSESDQAAFDPVLYPLAGALFLVIFFLAAGVSAVTAEYGTGMSRLTFTVTPKRGRVLAAKALTVAAATAVFSVVAYAGMIGPAQAIYGANDLPTAGVGDASLWRTLALLTLFSPLFPVLGVLVAAILRNGVGAIAVVLALVFAPEILGAMLPDWWRRNVVSLLPGPASDAVVIGHLTDSDLYLPPAAAVVVLAGWLAALSALAWLAVTRRDA